MPAKPAGILGSAGPAFIDGVMHTKSVAKLAGRMFTFLWQASSPYRFPTKKFPSHIK